MGHFGKKRLGNPHARAGGHGLEQQLGDGLLPANRVLVHMDLGQLGITDRDGTHIAEAGKDGELFLEKNAPVLMLCLGGFFALNAKQLFLFGNPPKR